MEEVKREPINITPKDSTTTEAQTVTVSSAHQVADTSSYETPAVEVTALITDVAQQVSPTITPKELIKFVDDYVRANRDTWTLEDKRALKIAGDILLNYSGNSPNRR